ncbi:tripartite tricarboxylate transporter TctB family protein [Alkalihalobacillus sp. CinArs1]|uniref:tripartite tricarboxylate transporter TctB family protein n=1 Tax=Alkalihalobacillus sp. CinArs1 TaxID=2995314 RepID=UPI0022DE5A49|nr:tripartite tricarboxylate transporter TctB family protein [Alkalihalobacillus sp. CinArs1]
MFNRLLGLGLILFSGTVWMLAGAFPEQNTSGPGPALFPQMLAVLLLILSISLMLTKENRHSEGLDKRGKIFFSLGVLMVILYVAIIQLIGFGVATLLVTIGWMWLMKIRKWWVLLTTSTLLPASVIFAFEYLLRVPIPHGLLY